MTASANGTSPEQGGAQSMEALCRDLKGRVDKFLVTPTDDETLRSVQRQIVIGKRVVEDALKRYRPEELSISYNGGKDCLVLLILILASLPTYFDSSSGFPDFFQALYIRPLSPFAEVDDFVAHSAAHYHLRLATSDLAMKPALGQYLADNKQVKAVFVGTRRTDPHGAKLTFFDETDRDWPRFMRIHPVIDWHYRQVWGFIRALDIPYCSLYDKGYTSLGGTDDTHPNPALKKDANTLGNEAKPSFRPAYELIEDDEERLGRE